MFQEVSALSTGPLRSAPFLRVHSLFNSGSSYICSASDLFDLCKSYFIGGGGHNTKVAFKLMVSAASGSNQSCKMFFRKNNIKSPMLCCRVNTVDIENDSPYLVLPIY